MNPDYAIEMYRQMALCICWWCRISHPSKSVLELTWFNVIFHDYGVWDM